jgi:hypothetical protein
MVKRISCTTIENNVIISYPQTNLGDFFISASNSLYTYIDIIIDNR